MTPQQRTSCVAAATLAATTLVTSLSAAPAEAAKVTVVFQNGRLVVIGSAAADTVTVTRKGSVVRVKVGGHVVKTKPKPTVEVVRAIVVRGLGGNDTLTIDNSQGPLPGATLRGGHGNDTLRGGTATDMLRGGPGHDVLRQSGGDDALTGDRGDDRYVLDVDGADVLVRLGERPGGGTDTVDFSATTSQGLEVGLDRPTQLVTPTYALALSSPGNFENLVGSALNDNLRGGPGPNTVLGGPGSDTLVTSPGADVLDGGTGDSQYAIDGDVTGSATVVDAGGPDLDVVSTWQTTTVDPTVDTGTTAHQAVSPSLQLRFSSGSAIDRLYGGARDDTLIGNDLANWIDGGGGADDVSGAGGADTLVASEGDDTLRGNDGDDTFVLSGDAHLVEAPGEGTDLLYFGETVPTGIDIDLSDTGAQAVNGSLDVQLNAGDTFENVTGTDSDDTIAGNALDNVLRGRAGTDTYVHHGDGDGIDTIADGLNSSIGERVRFESPTPFSASDLTIDGTATEVRDAASGTYGFDLVAPALDDTSYLVFGTTDQATDGQLITFNGAGGFTQGNNVDSLIATYATNGVAIGGAAGRDRIVDHSPHGNTLLGRDGADVLLGGAGADTLQGDRGFDPGVADALTGGLDGDTFRFGEALGGAAELFGADVVTDFGTGADTVDLHTTLSVRSGLGTSTVTIWDGVTDHGTITAANGHAWVAGDFT